MAAGERDSERNIEGAGWRIHAHLLVGGAEGRGAAHGALLIGAHEGPALADEKGLALAQLILDRGIALVLGAVAGVNDGAHYPTFSLAMASALSSAMTCWWASPASFVPA